jgi:hypothetical protein
VKFVKNIVARGVSLAIDTALPVDGGLVGGDGGARISRQSSHHPRIWPRHGDGAGIPVKRDAFMINPNYAVQVLFHVQSTLTVSN